MNAKGIYKIAWPIVVIGLFFYLSAFLQPILHLHVQQTPFLSTGDFFVEFLSRPGGLSQYLAQFIMQGFYNNLLGALILLAVIISLVLLFRLLISNVLNHSVPFWPFVLFITSLAIIQNYYFPLVVLIQSGFILLFLLLFTRTSLTSLSGWIKYLLLYLLLYYMAGTGAALIYAISAIVIILLKSSDKVYIKTAVIIFFSALIPYVAYAVFFNITLSEAYFKILPDLTILAKYDTTLWFYVYVFIIPILISMSGIYYKMIDKLPDHLFRKLKSKISIVIMGILLISGSVTLVKSGVDPVQRNVALCDYYNYTGNYDRTIDIALATTDDYNISINLSYNRAIANTGELTKRFFDYPQLLGGQILQPDRLGSPVFMMEASDLYFDLGYISEAQHFAYAVLAISPNNTRAQKRLVITNMLLGNVSAAKVYLKSLSHSLNNNAFIAKYKEYISNPALINDDPLFTAKSKYMPDNFAIPVQMTERLKDLTNKDDTNLRAHEFLQIAYLLDHRLNSFMTNLDASLKFYNSIPSIYEQAIIMYFYSEEIAGLEEFTISQPSKNKFNDYLSIMTGSENDLEPERNNLDAYSNTYMYYVNYLSPKVTNVKLIQQTY